MIEQRRSTLKYEHIAYFLHAANVVESVGKRFLSGHTHFNSLERPMRKKVENFASLDVGRLMFIS